MSNLVTLKGNYNPITELSQQRFKIVGESLVKNGVTFHMPRSVKRAISRYKNRAETTSFAFKLVPVSKTVPPKVVEEVIKPVSTVPPIFRKGSKLRIKKAYFHNTGITETTVKKYALSPLVVRQDPYNPNGDGAYSLCMEGDAGRWGWRSDWLEPWNDKEMWDGYNWVVKRPFKPGDKVRLRKDFVYNTGVSNSTVEGYCKQPLVVNSNDTNTKVRLDGDASRFIFHDEWLELWNDNEVWNGTNWVTKPVAKPAYIVSGNCVSFIYKGVSHQASSVNPMYKDILKHLQANQLDKAVELVNIANAIDKKSNGVIQNSGGVLKYNGVDLDDTVTNWLTNNMGRKDGALEAVISFMRKCNSNPSPGSVDMLWRFIKNNSLVLFPDGDFLGYRYIREDFKDAHSGKFDNSPGKVCQMPREEVTYDPKNSCAPGLHVGSWDFVQGNSTIIEVKVNPFHVVSVPENESGKMRVCEFLSWKLLKHKGVDKAERTEHFVTL